MRHVPGETMNLRLYFDEDAMDADLVVALRGRGVDLETALEIDMLDARGRRAPGIRHNPTTGPLQLQYRSFLPLHRQFLASGQNHAGMIVCRQQHYGVGEQMRRLLKLIAAKTGDEMHNQLEFLSQWG